MVKRYAYNTFLVKEIYAAQNVHQFVFTTSFSYIRNSVPCDSHMDAHWIYGSTLVQVNSIFNWGPRAVNMIEPRSALTRHWLYLVDPLLHTFRGQRLETTSLQHHTIFGLFWVCSNFYLLVKQCLLWVYHFRTDMFSSKSTLCVESNYIIKWLSSRLFLDEYLIAINEHVDRIAIVVLEERHWWFLTNKLAIEQRQLQTEQQQQFIKFQPYCENTSVHHHPRPLQLPTITYVTLQIS